MKKKLLSLALIFIMLVGAMYTLAGCGKKSNFSVDEILQYMSDKYGEDFTYVEPIDINQPTASSLAIFVENENYPNKRIFAKCILENGEKRFCDNFITYIYEDDTREILTKLSKSVYPDAQIRYSLGNYNTSPSSYSNDGKLTFEKYLSRTNSSISYVIGLPSSHDDTIYKEEVEKLCELFKENKVVCSVTIVYLKDDSQFEKFITDGEYDYNGYKLRGDISVNQNFDIEFEEWR